MERDVHRITRIEAQKKNKNRYSLYLNDRFALGVDQSVLLEFGLATGDSLNPERLEAIERAESVAQAKKKALSLIAYRRRSVEECRGRLARHGFAPDVIQHALEDLIRVHLLDDAAFAEAYAHTRLIGKPVSKTRLAAELRARGLGENHIRQGLRTVLDGTSDEALAAGLVKKRLARYAGEDPVRTRKKLSDFLLRRGFSPDVIQTVLETALEWKNDQTNKDESTER